MKYLDDSYKTNFKKQLAYITFYENTVKSLDDFFPNIFNNSEQLALNVINCILKDEEVLKDKRIIRMKDNVLKKLVTYIPNKILEQNISDINNNIEEGFKNIENSDNIFFEFLIRGFQSQLEQKNINDYNDLLNNSDFLNYMIYKDLPGLFDDIKVKMNILQCSNLRNDKNFMLKVIENYPEALKYSNLINDENFMLNVIEKNLKALEYSDLRNDKEFMLKAIEKNVEVLKYSKLRNTEKFILKIIEKYPEALKYSENLKEHSEFILKVIEKNPKALEYSPSKNSPTIMLKIIEEYPEALEYSPLKNDPEFMSMYDIQQLDKTDKILKEQITSQSPISIPSVPKKKD